jgi:2-methylcitrate dehydratase PrpD
MTITRDLATFAQKISYEQLPLTVVHQTKRLILDSVGCALGGLATRKGQYAISLARTLGGPLEASLLGTDEKVSVAVAAYASGELINALDYEALLSPPDHATPYVLAALLAMGESKGVSGKELIVASAVAHEMATRIASGLVFGARFRVEVPEQGVVMGLPTPGYGLCLFAGVAACGRLFGLDADGIAQAMGIAGYQVPVPMLMKFSMTTPPGMPKYLSAGILAQQEVMSVLSAAMGSTGDTEVLDGEYGFWRAFGCDAWRPEAVGEALGKTWYFPERLFYKFFPCCGAMQNTLALFRQILSENALSPENIREVRVKLNPLAALPVWRGEKLATHIDAQFNVPYVFAVLAHGVHVGPAWQREKTLTDDRITGFMKKVSVITEINAEVREQNDVEVITHAGAGTNLYAKHGVAMDLAMDDAGLEEKFIRNCSTLLDENRARTAASALLELESVVDIREVFGLISPCVAGLRPAQDDVRK